MLRRTPSEPFQSLVLRLRTVDGEPAGQTVSWSSAGGRVRPVRPDGNQKLQKHSRHTLKTTFLDFSAKVVLFTLYSYGRDHLKLHFKSNHLLCNCIVSECYVQNYFYIEFVAHYGFNYYSFVSYSDIHKFWNM